MSLMSLKSTALSLLLASSFALAACGGSGEAAGLKYRVSDKELRGLTGDGVVRIEAAKGEVMKLEDAYALGNVEGQEKKKDIAQTGDKKEAAGDAIEKAADTIEETQDKEQGELAKARSERDKKIADAKAKYEEQQKQIREKYAREQEKNRKVLADAKTTQIITGLEHNLLKAELAENKARQDLKKQEIRVAKAQLEVTKYEELLKQTNVVGAKETQRKINLEQQALNEQKKLVDLQAKLAKAEQHTAGEKAKLDAERQKLLPKPPQ